MQSVTLAERIRGDELLLGLLVKMPAPAIVETGGRVGFDFVVLDTEHGDATGLEHHLRAAGSVGIDCLVRVGDKSDLGILRALDSGAAGVVVPHVTTVAEAEGIVQAAHYPPRGRRGLSATTRAGGHGVVPLAEHVALAGETTVVIAQLEDQEALPHARAIANVDRLDGIFVGRSDLSASLGFPGEIGRPEVVAAVDQIIEALKGTEAALCVIASSPEEAHAWAARGTRMVVFTAMALLAKNLAQLVSQTRNGRAA